MALTALTSRLPKVFHVSIRYTDGTRDDYGDVQGHWTEGDVTRLLSNKDKTVHFVLFNNVTPSPTCFTHWTD